jgi:ankyrin repeat protein
VPTHDAACHLHVCTLAPSRPAPHALQLHRQAQLDALTVAARDGDVGTVRALVAQGVPVNGRDTFGYVALFWAVAKARKDVVQVLLNAGADPDAQCHGMSVVARAATDSTADILRLLLASGGSVNLAKSDGTTPLLALAK